MFDEKRKSKIKLLSLAYNFIGTFVAIFFVGYLLDRYYGFNNYLMLISTFVAILSSMYILIKSISKK